MSKRTTKVSQQQAQTKVKTGKRKTTRTDAPLSGRYARSEGTARADARRNS